MNDDRLEDDPTSGPDGPNGSPAEGLDGAPAVVATVSWRKDGRCSACTLFTADFGEPPELFGHCKMYPRSGARESENYACGEYRPLPGFAQLTESVSFEKRLQDDYKRDAARSAGRRSSSSSGSSRRRSPAAVYVPRVRKEITSNVLAMFAGGEDTEEGTMDPEQLRDVLIDVVENFLNIEDVPLGQKWSGGTVTLQPADPELKPHVLEVESFFHKVVMIRDRLRVLEQKLNAHPKLSDTEKIDMQSYISRCYGSLTTLNVLFKDKDDRFSSK